MAELSGILKDLYVTIQIELRDLKNNLGIGDGNTWSPEIVRKYMPKYHSDRFFLQEIERMDQELEGIKERYRSEMSDKEKETVDKLYQKYGPIKLDIGCPKG